MDAAIPMILHCPSCSERHIDEGRFATTKLHHTHACQHCGTLWRPAIANTVGVAFLPGFKDPTGHLFEQILGVRRRQDEQWGGPQHDDELDLDEWVPIAERQLQEADAALAAKLGDPDRPDDPNAVWRDRMIQVAAVCIAALESFDRKKAHAEATAKRWEDYEHKRESVGTCSDACLECGMNLNCKPTCTTQTYPIAR